MLLSLKMVAAFLTLTPVGGWITEGSLPPGITAVLITKEREQPYLSSEDGGVRVVSWPRVSWSWVLLAVL